ncbi:FkbM family methyltransferase [Amycolatopsis alkalitolerans]|uniref:FkbM family methyltransferase n=1 Tax=Amycolatopsis alkalitolerans TaxID=2547244 RepID=A0A5C4LSC5_9PSEU|nr:FkbM family methyltransferase [Amycolatopsis alkalitolerans]TNC21870.1 FkbM family methyltransferase [Amycolatopsis alkalitolerans]
MKLTRSALTGLRARLHPRLLAPLGSIALTVKRRERCTVRFRDGNWIHRYPTGAIVRPVLGGASARMVDDTTSETFLRHYRPRPGDTVVDLGAGVGTEARLLSRLAGPTGMVVCVEPHPRTFSCLQRTIALNGLDNVIAVRCAIAGTSGTVFVEDTSDYNANGITGEPGGVRVRAETLDDLVRRFGLDRIDLLKMNIEGAELAVLDAARDVLPRVRNLVVSCHDFKADRGGPHWQRTFGGVRALLTDAGYTLHARPPDARPWIPYYVYASR